MSLDAYRTNAHPEHVACLSDVLLARLLSRPILSSLSAIKDTWLNIWALLLHSRHNLLQIRYYPAVVLQARSAHHATQSGRGDITCALIKTFCRTSTRRSVEDVGTAGILRKMIFSTSLTGRDGSGWRTIMTAPPLSGTYVYLQNGLGRCPS